MPGSERSPLVVRVVRGALANKIIKLNYVNAKVFTRDLVIAKLVK